MERTNAIASQLGIDEVYAEKAPEEKLKIIVGVVTVIKRIISDVNQCVVIA